MKKIKKVAILGGGGNMGSQSGGIFAQSSIPCCFFDMTKEIAEKGKANAIRQAKSEVLDKYIETYSFDDMEKIIPECDWIFEALPENMEIKKTFFDKIEKFRSKGTVVSTVSSGLSIEELVKGRDSEFQENFCGVHFYNPPSKLIANEITYHSSNNEEFKTFIYDYCEKVLYRKNLETLNVPGFAGNRIGFQTINEAAQYAQKYGAEKIDYLLGPHTGRAMAPIATIDLVGLDVHKAIVEYVYENTNDERHEAYKMPDYMYKMMDAGMLGFKTRDKGGFFYRDAEKQKFVLDVNSADLKRNLIKKEKIEFVENIKAAFHDGDYEKGIRLMKETEGEDSDIIRHFILGYVSYSFFRIGEVTPEKDGIHGIDTVMAYGFSWLPPSGWVDLFGGPKETVAMMEKASLPVPESLKSLPEEKICRVPSITKFLMGR